MKKKLLLLMAGLLIQQDISDAETINQPDYDYSTTYFDIGAGWGVITNLPTGAFAGSIAAGYNFNRYFGLEGAWTTLPSNQWGNLSNYNLYTMNLKGIIPVTDTWSIYAKGGTGIGYSSWSGTQGSPVVYQNPGSATTWVAQASLGTSLALGDHFNIYLENSSYFPLTSQNGSFATTNATFLGFQFNFSAPAKAINANSHDALAEVKPVITTGTVAPVTQPAVNVSNNTLTEGSPIATIPAVTAASIATTSKSTPHTNALENDAYKQIKNPEFKARVSTDSAGRHYVITNKNETLYRMSVNSGLSEGELRKINHLRGNTIVTGQRFYLD